MYHPAAGKKSTSSDSKRNSSLIDLPSAASGIFRVNFSQSVDRGTITLQCLDGIDASFFFKKFLAFAEVHPNGDVVLRSAFCVTFPDDEFAAHEYGGVPFLQVERSVEFMTEYDPPFLHGVNEWFL